MNISQDSFNDSLGDFSMDKDKLSLPTLIDSFSEYCELSKRVENIKIAAKFAGTFDITRLEEELIKHVLPAVVHVFKEIYDKNCELSPSKQEELKEIRCNFQVALSLIEVSSTFLKPICDEDRSIQFRYVRSLPINVAQIVFSTFEHCKNSQKIYASHFNSIVEILELFRNTQSLHSKLLNVVEAKLEFNHSSESDINGLTQILGTLCQIGNTISGLNAKSMTDNWRAYTTLNKKYLDVLHNDPDFDLSNPIKSITNEIEENFSILKTLKRSDIKTAMHLIKVTGFLTKVALKLIELNWKILENFHTEVISFYVVFHSCRCDYFKARKFPDEIIQEFNSKFTGIVDGSLKKSITEESFSTHLTSLDNSTLPTDLMSNSFGLLVFLNEVIKITNQGDFTLMKPELIINVIFDLTVSCFVELSTFDESLYEELIVNLSVLILTLTDLYSKIEVILLKNILQDEILPAMLAIDLWASILGNSPPEITCAVLCNILSKIEDLNVGIFTQSPQLIQLRSLVRRIFDSLPNNSKNELISKYSPSENLPVWKFLELRAIPLSQRFQIETVLIDFYERSHCIQKTNLEDFLFIAETLDILSCVEFSAIQLNTSKLTTAIGRLWSFNPYDLIQSNNNFYKYFVTKLVKITKTLIHQFPGEILLLILNQTKVFARNTQLVFKILANEIIHPLVSSTFDHFHEKSAILSCIYEILLIILNDTNGIIVGNALETLRDFASNENLDQMTRKIQTNGKVSKLIEKYEEKSDDYFDWSYLRKLSQNKFEHKCVEWTETETTSEILSRSPQKKKIKVDEEVNIDVADDVINGLQNEAKRLQSVIKTSRLSPKQVRDVRAVISRLEMLI